MTHPTPPPVGYLCINRYTDQQVLITLPNGEQVEIRLLAGRRGYAKLGFRAPRHIKIDRREIAESPNALGLELRAAS